MSSIDYFSGEQLAIISSVVASLISEGLTVDEQNVWGNFLAAVGAALLTIAAVNAAQAPGQTVVG